MQPIRHFMAPCIRWPSCNHRRALRIVLLAAIPLIMLKGISQTPRLAFSSERSGRCQVYHVPLPGNADQGMPVRVTCAWADSQESSRPDCGPIGKRIAYEFGASCVCRARTGVDVEARDEHRQPAQAVARVLVAHGLLEIGRRGVSQLVILA